MNELDIRIKQSVVELIRIADNNEEYGVAAASLVSKWSSGDNYIQIKDSRGEYVVINGSKHARYLIAALEKSIELGWLE